MRKEGAGGNRGGGKGGGEVRRMKKGVWDRVSSKVRMVNGKRYGRDRLIVEMGGMTTAECAQERGMVRQGTELAERSSREKRGWSNRGRNGRPGKGEEDGRDELIERDSRIGNKRSGRRRRDVGGACREREGERVTSEGEGRLNERVEEEMENEKRR